MMTRTTYGRRLAGGYAGSIMIAVILLLIAVPWEYIYTLEWYKKFLSVMSIISPNLSNLQESSNKFPEYSIAFTGFINAIGPWYAIYGLYLGVKHYVELKDVFLHKPVTNIKLIGVILGVVTIMLALFWGVYVSSGGKGDFILRYLYGAEWRYVATHTVLWSAMAMVFFVLSCVVSMLFDRLKNKMG